MKLNLFFGRKASLANYYPARDWTLGNWTPSGGGYLYGCINEQPADDATFIRSGVDPAGDGCEIGFGNVVVPSGDSNHKVSYRIRADGSCALTVGLYCGASLIQQWAHGSVPAAWQQFDQSVDPANAVNILDYANLRLRMTAS